MSDEKPSPEPWLPRASSGLTTEQLWARPRGAASVGFHLRHVAGSIDRLHTGQAIATAKAVRGT